MKTLPIAFLRECFRYDASSGALVWLERPRSHFKSARGWNLFNSKFPGERAGTVSKTTGYVVVNLQGNLFGAHRIAWAMHNGAWPLKHLDHRDGQRARNSIVNLRECERSDNQCNRGVQSNNTSRLKGAHRHADGVWRSRVKRGDRTVDLGLFGSPDAAHAAYVAAARQLHGEFARAQ